jgi:hypothetical protein
VLVSMAARSMRGVQPSPLLSSTPTPGANVGRGPLGVKSCVTCTQKVKSDLITHNSSAYRVRLRVKAGMSLGSRLVWA